MGAWAAVIDNRFIPFFLAAVKQYFGNSHQPIFQTKLQQQKTIKQFFQWIRVDLNSISDSKEKAKIILWDTLNINMYIYYLSTLSISVFKYPSVFTYHTHFINNSADTCSYYYIYIPKYIFHYHYVNIPSVIM